MKQIQPCSEKHVRLVSISVQLCGQLRSPASGVPQPVRQLLVHQSLAGHSPPVPVRN